MPTNGRSIHVRSQSLERPLRPGDFVEVLPFAEIAVTLDARGELDGLPFMAEMLPFCGGRFEVWKRADKTCDEGAGSEIRRLENTVHLICVATVAPTAGAMPDASSFGTRNG